MDKPKQETLDQFARDLDQIREETMEKVGSDDARYIRTLIGFQRVLDISSRLTMALVLVHPAFFIAGILGLALAKILENMEIGHNVMHGQYDWMNDPDINSRHYEWDIAADGASWKRYHNHEHHTYTNVIGKDRDFGYGLLRLSDDYAWRPKNLWQFLTYLNLSFLFEWGVAYHEVAGERVFRGKARKDSTLPISRKTLRNDFFRKIGRQVFKDYVFFPLLFWPVALYVLAGNAIANVLRNLWTSSVIFCGHFTDGIHTFQPEEIRNESRGQWYYRQILGSSNLSGSKIFHILTGHLSCQVEHHLFPDVPAPRYREMAPKVQAVCQKYGIPYNTGRLGKQYLSVVKRILKYSLPQRHEREARTMST